MWQRLAPFEKSAEMIECHRLASFERFAERIERHRDRIAAYCKPENKAAFGLSRGSTTRSGSSGVAPTARGTPAAQSTQDDALADLALADLTKSESSKTPEWLPTRIREDPAFFFGGHQAARCMRAGRERGCVRECVRSGSFCRRPSGPASRPVLAVGRSSSSSHTLQAGGSGSKPTEAPSTGEPTRTANVAGRGLRIRQPSDMTGEA